MLHRKFVLENSVRFIVNIEMLSKVFVTSTVHSHISMCFTTKAHRALLSGVVL